MIYAVLIRRLRPDSTFEQFREAWLPDEPFEVPVKVANARRIDDPRELISIGRADISGPDVPAFLERVAASEARRHERIAHVIEDTVHSGIYEVLTDDDLGPA